MSKKREKHTATLRRNRKNEIKASEMKRVDGIHHYNLDEIDRQIMKIKIQYPTITNQEIADIVGVDSQQVVNYRINRPGFQSAFAEVTATTEEHMRTAANQAARRLKRLVNDDDKQVALQAIKMALHQYLNKAELTVTAKPAMVFRSTIAPDGSLIQEVYEEQKSLSAGNIGYDDERTADAEFVDADQGVKD